MIYLSGLVEAPCPERGDHAKDEPLPALFVRKHQALRAEGLFSAMLSYEIVAQGGGTVSAAVPRQHTRPFTPHTFTILSTAKHLHVHSAYFFLDFLVEV